MKRSFITVTVLSSLFMSAGAFAENGSTEGTLTIKGNIAGTTCHFVNGSDNATNSMNDIGVDQFTNVQIGSPVTTYSNTTTLPLKVKCDSDTNPRITFSDSQFDNNGITINTGTQNGAGFVVFYGRDASEKITGDKNINLKSTDKNNNNEYELYFKAQYAKVAEPVVYGEVNSTITMTVLTD